jgi:N-dimethylarginine dimethylaminohydrolase
MPPTVPAGPSVAATYGGPGWLPRLASHREEVMEGRIWRPCRVSSETAPLKAVLLALPGQEMDFCEPPDAWLMLERPDRSVLEAQVRALAGLYARHGVEVHFSRPSHAPPPNFLFQRDLFAMTPEGAILGRPAARQRAGEERWAAQVLAALGVPILHTMRGTATFEGADLLWMRPDRVLLGTGRRTNEAGRAEVEAVLRDLGVEVLPVPVPEGAQHLLGIVNFLADDLAVVHGGRSAAAVDALIGAHGVRSVVLPEDDELVRGRGMNFVTLAPREVLMPSGCPGIRSRLEAEGVRVHEAEVGEALKAAGGPGCLTGILWRESPAGGRTRGATAGRRAGPHR